MATVVVILGIPAGTAAAGPAGQRHEVSRRATAPLRAFAVLTGGVRDRRFIGLAGLNGLLTLHNSLLVIGIPLWIVARRVLPVAVVPAFTLLNTILVVLLQVRVASAAKSTRDAGRSMLRAGVALAAACVLVGASAGPFSAGVVLALLVVAVICQTVAELDRSAGGWHIALSRAQGDTAGRYLAVFSLGSAAEALVGPALFADGVVSSGASGWWIIAVAFGIAGVIAWRLATGWVPVPPGSSGVGEGAVEQGQVPRSAVHVRADPQQRPGHLQRRAGRGGGRGQDGVPGQQPGAGD
jgi:hypothetical protein